MTPSLHRPLTRRLRAALAAAAAAAALAGCGGGSSQIDPFEAQRLFVFGDELSALAPDGRRWSINAIGSVVQNGQTVERFDCAANPLWVQSLASSYGFVFAECNPNAVTDIRARNFAAPNATVAAVTAQIDAQVAAGGFRDKDLATMLAGANDVLELYRGFPAQSEGELINEARARGTRFAQQVNRLVALGAKVIVSTVPDMGLTPYALAQGADRAALLTRLTAAFNEQLGVNVLLDGRFIGLVQTDLQTQALVRAPGAFGLSNVTSAACRQTAVLPACDTKTLVDGATSTAYLWADSLWPSPVVHARMGALAVDRARRNPF